MRRLLACLLAVVGFGAFSFAQDAESRDGKKPSDTTLSLTLATSLEAKLTITKTIGFEGDFGTLDLKPTAYVSPVSLNAGGDVVYTLPLPLLEFSAGVLGGSGWYLAPVGVNGVGVYDGEDKDGEDVYTKKAFGNFMYKGKAGAALQFDLAVLVPGDWNHVQFRTYHEIYYRALTGVTSKKWVYEGTADNYNQPKYYSNYVLAYALPKDLVVSRVGALFTDDVGLTHSSSLVNAGGLMSLQFGENFSIDMVVLAKKPGGEGFSFDKAAFVFNYGL
jgi:hypothetical protein